jgi:dihydroorotate dehydrogenase electron transfer subunit
MVHSADHAKCYQAKILQHSRLAQDTMRLRLELETDQDPGLPGQFYMLRDLRSCDPLIGRAFAMYDCDPAGSWVEIVYLIKGKLTSSIAQLEPGRCVSLWGPLGNSFDSTPTDHLIMVAGGIGQTPLLCLAKEALGQQRFGQRPAGYANRVSLCYGVRSQRYLAGLDAFQQAAVNMHLATDDGSAGGPPRLVTDLFVEILEKQTSLSGTRVVCCGPEPMMQAVAQIAGKFGVACQVSLETPMACGLGICFTCVAKVGTAEQWDYKRTCVEGPIFDAAEIVW